MKKIFYLLAFILTTICLIITWPSLFPNTSQKKLLPPLPATPPPIGLSAPANHLTPPAITRPVREPSTSDSKPPSASTDKIQCIKREDLEKLDKQWNESIGLNVDEEGELFPEEQYLESLDQDTLQTLAEQDYPAAMADLAIKLLNSEDTQDITAGRQWAFKAAVHGKLESLSYLSFSYLNEFQALENTDQKEKAHIALQNYQASLSLLENIAPGSTSDSDLLGPVELTQAQTKALNQKTTALIQNYKQQRSQAGLEELNIRITPPPPEEQWVICPE